MQSYNYFTCIFPLALSSLLDMLVIFCLKAALKNRKTKVYLWNLIDRNVLEWCLMLWTFFFFFKAMAKFHAPVIQDNPSGWGPCAVPEKFKDMPYQPFSKGDRLGKVHSC